MYENRKDVSFNVINKSQEPLCRGVKERIRLMKRNEPKQDKNKEQVEESDFHSAEKVSLARLITR